MKGAAINTVTLFDCAFGKPSQTSGRMLRNRKMVQQFMLVIQARAMDHSVLDLVLKRPRHARGSSHVPKHAAGLSAYSHRAQRARNQAGQTSWTGNDGGSLRRVAARTGASIAGIAAAAKSARVISPPLSTRPMVPMGPLVLPAAQVVVCEGIHF